MQDAIIILTVFSVPLTAIVSSVWLKAKKLDSETGGQKLREKIDALDEQNRDLKRRIEVLESIAIDSRAIESERAAGIVGARRLDAVAASVESSVAVDSAVARR